MKFTPKDDRLVDQCVPLIKFCLENMLNFDRDRDGITTLEFVSDGGYTKSDSILMGFFVGGAIPHGSVRQLIEISHGGDDAAVEEIFEWWQGNKSKNVPGAGFLLSKGEKSSLLQSLLEISNLEAFCRAMFIAMEMPSKVPALKELVEEAKESGIEETVF